MRGGGHSGNEANNPDQRSEWERGIQLENTTLAERVDFPGILVACNEGPF
jgi:hypothetical protein